MCGLSSAGVAFVIGFILLSGTFFPPIWGIGAIVVLILIATAGDEEDG